MSRLLPEREGDREKKMDRLKTPTPSNFSSNTANFILAKKPNITGKSLWKLHHCIVLVKKKDGSKRLCIDYLGLNDVTIKDAYPLPRIYKSLDQLARSRCFSFLVMNAGYWQIKLDTNDRPKTAFISRNGLFQFIFLTFGLSNAAATFERLGDMLSIFRWHHSMQKNVWGYCEKSGWYFGKITRCLFEIEKRKSQLFSTKVEFLWHIVSKDGKTECIWNWSVPNNLNEVKSYIGFCSYYCRFIFKLSGIAKPFIKLTEKGVPFKWTLGSHSYL